MGVSRPEPLHVQAPLTEYALSTRERGIPWSLNGSELTLHWWHPSRAKAAVNLLGAMACVWPPRPLDRCSTAEGSASVGEGIQQAAASRIGGCVCRSSDLMRSIGRRRRSVVVVGWLVVSGLLWSHPTFADEKLKCLEIPFARILQGLALAPVPLNTEGKNILLVGLGSYIVNAQGGCNDCHTNPPYAPGGDPFQGEPELINAAGYLAGGLAFGPFVSRNLTPCADENPAGLSFEEFVQVMRTGVDFKDGQSGPPDTPILQVMPWPILAR
jgi:hypothetical protein